MAEWDGGAEEDWHQWLNPAYGRASTIQEARQTFAASRPLSHLQAQQFLHEEKAEHISRLLNLSEWESVDVPHLHSFRRLASKKELARFCDVRRFCLSGQFATFLGLITGLDLRVREFFPISYPHGGYTLLHDARRLKPGMDVFLDLSGRFPENSGGEIVYMTSSRELIRVKPCQNALTIIPRPFGVMRYVKYINHRAGKNVINQVWLSGW